MDRRDIIIRGDVAGHDWRLPVIHFAGTAAGPKTYIQAALHAGELPGVAAAHFLILLLAKAETRGEILGDITIVPQANPIGTAQFIAGEMQGRFDNASRINFNRGYPLPAFYDRASLLADLDRHLATEQLKRHLLSMAIDSELMLDLHCDDQSLQYAYMHGAFWPEGADLAACLDMKAVLLSDGQSDAFEEAVTLAWLRPQPGVTLVSRPCHVSVTVELRGTSDVYPDFARKDAAGLYRFLQERGVVGGEKAPLGAFTGPVVPLDHVEMIRAKAAGTILFHADVGEQVKAGDRLATIITTPGDVSGQYDVVAPQDGLVLTRVSVRYARNHDNLMKIVCASPTAGSRKSGALED